MSQAQLIFEKQWLHASLLAVLLAGLAVASGLDAARSGELWGITTPLAVALFNHLYIWVHYFATELPDMKRIYGQARAEAPQGHAER